MNASLPAVLTYPVADPPPPAAALEVAPGVWWLRLPLPFALDHINVWLLADGAGWTQVDCGYGDAPTRALWAAHFGTTLAGRSLRQIIATHYHPDHLGNAAWLGARYGCPVTMAQAEFLTARLIAGGDAAYGADATCALFRAHGMDDDQLAALRARGNHYRRGVPELPANFRRLMGEEEVAIGAHRWRAIAGFGHSPEHLALHCPELRVCISGDMLLPRISTNVAVWPAEADGDPLGRFLASLDRFEALPPDTLVLPSHGLPFFGAALRVAELRAHHAARLAELEAATTAPQTAAALVPVLFRRPLDVQQRFFAMGEAIAHLNHLWHAGRFRRTIDRAGIIRFGRDV